MITPAPGVAPRGAWLSECLDDQTRPGQACAVFIVSAKSGAIMAVKSAAKINKSCGLAPTCGRSGGAAGAVRGRTNRPRPDCRAHVWRKRLASLCPCHLTPAHLFATSLASHFADRHGSGTAVAVQLRCNRFATGNQLKSLRFMDGLRGCNLAPRAMRARAYVRSRAHICARNAATLQPLYITYIYHMFSGCSEVAGGLQLQPDAMGVELRCRAVLRPNILSAGYSSKLVQASIWGNSEAARRESFRDFGGAVGRSAWRAAVWRNGGFLRFWWDATAAVGRVASEGCRQVFDVARFSGDARLPDRLVRSVTVGRSRRPSVADRPGRCPQRAGHFARPLADPIFRIWNSIGPRRAKSDARRRVGVKNRELVRRQRGSGGEIRPIASRRNGHAGTCGVACQ